MSWAHFSHRRRGKRTNSRRRFFTTSKDIKAHNRLEASGDQSYLPAILSSSCSGISQHEELSAAWNQTTTSSLSRVCYHAVRRELIGSFEIMKSGNETEENGGVKTADFDSSCSMTWKFWFLLRHVCVSCSKTTTTTTTTTTNLDDFRKLWYCFRRPPIYRHIMLLFVLNARSVQDTIQWILTKIMCLCCTCEWLYARENAVCSTFEPLPAVMFLGRH